MTVIKILIAAHKKSLFPEKDFFLPVQVGSSLAVERLDIQGDDGGENISEKNNNYCELTALYWAWKNLKTDIIGLCHYRRYFKFKKNTFLFGSRFEIPFSKLDKHIPADWEIERILSNCDIILAKPDTYPYSLEVEYKSNHIPEDMEIVSRIIQRLYPDYYPTWINVMRYNNKLSHYNMFICKYELFNTYCRWLFDILHEAEKEIKLSPYIYQQRVFGFLSERLLLLYCKKNKLKIAYRPILFLNDTKPMNQKLYLIKTLLKNISFYTGNPRAILKIFITH